MMFQTNWHNFPTYLTLSRLILSPLILPFLLVCLLPYNLLWLNLVLSSLFSALALTDFFDGYLARKYKQISSLGKMLDPIADKFLLYSSLISLLAVEKMYFYWVIVLTGRELFIVCLRMVAMQYGITLSVSHLAKVKTALQMFLIAFVIINPYQKLGIQGAPHWNGVELILLATTLILSILSAVLYCCVFFTELQKKSSPKLDVP